MGIEREKFLETLADSFSAYYDLHMAQGDTELPLVFRADYHSRAERYWLSKNITIWGNETNEFAYIFSAPSFEKELAAKCIDYCCRETYRAAIIQGRQLYEFDCRFPVEVS